uniref:Securin n=1 Tax=Naja naja TaxID=35670 RepID=A0A8C6VM97_NAJNA
MVPEECPEKENLFSYNPLGNAQKGKSFRVFLATEDSLNNQFISDPCLRSNGKLHFIVFCSIDFESFDVPEEHRLSHMSLTGVPLMTFDNVPDRFTSSIPLPPKQPLVSWDYDCLQSTKDFLATLDEIVIDLPPPL